MDQQSTCTDITVNVDGFLMLQALLDIRHVAPELRCRVKSTRFRMTGQTSTRGWRSASSGNAAQRRGHQNKCCLDEGCFAAPGSLKSSPKLSRGKLLYG